MADGPLDFEAAKAVLFDPTNEVDLCNLSSEGTVHFLVSKSLEHISPQSNGFADDDHVGISLATLDRLLQSEELACEKRAAHLDLLHILLIKAKAEMTMPASVSTTALAPRKIGMSTSLTKAQA